MVLIEDIDRDCDGLATAFVDLVRRLLPACLIYVGNHNDGALPSQAKGDGLTDSPTRTCDNRSFPPKLLVSRHGCSLALKNMAHLLQLFFRHFYEFENRSIWVFQENHANLSVFNAEAYRTRDKLRPLFLKSAVDRKNALDPEGEVRVIRHSQLRVGSSSFRGDVLLQIQQNIRMVRGSEPYNLHHDAGL